MARIFVIGIGYRPLGARAQGALAESKRIFASDRLLEVFMRCDEYGASMDRLEVINDVSATFGAVKKLLEDGPESVITILASGDPMFFGIGSSVAAEFGKDLTVIIPDISCVQQAFARICEPWDDAFLVGMHGGPCKDIRRKTGHELKDLPALLAEHKKLAALTDSVNNPAVIASVFEGMGQGAGIIIHVCERLGYPDERIITGTPREIAAGHYSEPNVVIVRKIGRRTGSCGKGHNQAGK
jgi:precorrin-6B C5,15-methyltransferase / cobalt-precorrin-6B C5,C15-methyltransferase